MPNEETGEKWYDTYRQDFDAFTKEKINECCMGTRKWFVDLLVKWWDQQDSESNLFWLVGSGGTGKTVMTAKAIEALSPGGRTEKPAHVVPHFCRFFEEKKSTPVAVLGNIASTLYSDVEFYRNAMDETAVEEALKKGELEEIFQTVLKDPLEKLKDKKINNDADVEINILLLIDALDELRGDSRKDFLTLLRDIAKVLPSWMKMFISSRDEFDIKTSLKGFKPFEIRVDDKRNKEDLELYGIEIVRKNVNKLCNSANSDAVQAIIESSQGLMIYARCVEITLEQKKVSGKISYIEFFRIPIGIDGIYIKSFDRVFVYSVKDGERNIWIEMKTLLSLIVSAAEPLPVELARRILGWDLAKMEDAKKKISLIFPVKDGERFYSIHKSVVDWITTERSKHYQLSSETIEEAHQLFSRFLVSYLKNNIYTEGCTEENSAITDVEVAVDLGIIKGNDSVEDEVGDSSIIQNNKFESTSECFARKRKRQKNSSHDEENSKVLLDKVKETSNTIEEVQSEATSLKDVIIQSTEESDIQDFRNKAPTLKTQQTIRNEDIISEENSLAGEIIYKYAMKYSVTHCCQSGDAKILENARNKILLNFNWLLSKIIEMDPYEAAEDYGLYLSVRREDRAIFLLSSALRASLSAINVQRLQIFPQFLGGRLSMKCENRPNKDILNFKNHMISLLKKYAVKVTASTKGEGNNLIIWIPFTENLPPAGDFCQNTLADHSDYVVSVSFSPDGKKICSGSRDKTLRIWNANNGKCLAKLEGYNRYGYSHFVNSVAWSSDGKCICSGSSDKSIRVWDADLGESKLVLEGHTKGVCSVTWSPENDFVASGSEDNSIKVWSINTGECENTLKGHTRNVNSVCWSPKGDTIASGSDDRTVRLWNVANRECVQIFTEHTSYVFSVAFSPDGNRLCSAGGDKKIILWDGKSLNVFEGHSEWIWSIAWSPDGNKIVSGSRDKTVKIWSLDSNDCSKTFSGHSDRVYSVSWSSDGSLICSGSGDKTVKIWDCLAEGQSKKEKKEGHTNKIHCVSFSRDGSKVATGSADKTVRVWDSNEGVCLQHLKGHSRPVLSVMFSTDGSKLFSIDCYGKIRVWDMDSDECLETYESKIGRGWYSFCGWSSDETEFALKSHDDYDAWKNNGIPNALFQRGTRAYYALLKRGTRAPKSFEVWKKTADDKYILSEEIKSEYWESSGASDRFPDWEKQTYLKKFPKNEIGFSTDTDTNPEMATNEDNTRCVVPYQDNDGYFLHCLTRYKIDEDKVLGDKKRGSNN